MQWGGVNAWCKASTDLRSQPPSLCHPGFSPPGAFLVAHVVAYTGYGGHRGGRGGGVLPSNMLFVFAVSGMVSVEE